MHFLITETKILFEAVETRRLRPGQAKVRTADGVVVKTHFYNSDLNQSRVRSSTHKNIKNNKKGKRWRGKTQKTLMIVKLMPQ